MRAMLVSCPRCKGTGLTRIPSVLLEPTVTSVTVFGFGVPEKLQVRRTFPAKCRLCDGTGRLPVELPALINFEDARRECKECGGKDVEGI